MVSRRRYEQIPRVIRRLLVLEFLTRNSEVMATFYADSEHE